MADGAAIPPGARFERGVSALLWALPLLYVLTDMSPAPVWWRWSAFQLALLGAGAVTAAIWLASYSWRLPRAVATTRRAVVAAGLGGLLAVLGLEVGLRALDGAPYEAGDNRGRHASDPDVGHVFALDHEQVLQTREYRVTFRSNSQGVRADRNYGPKTADVVRVLCLGDSFTAGEQVPLEESWPGALERLLNEDEESERFEVVNAGFPGFCTENEARWLAKFGAVFDPDVVLLAMTPNDLLENEVPVRLTARNGALTSLNATEGDERAYEERGRWYSLRGHVERSFVHGVITGSVFWRKLAKRPRYTHFRAYSEELDARGRAQYEAVQADLLEARDAAAGLGATFALVVVPFREQLTELQAGLDPLIFGARMTAFAEQAGIPAVDVLPAFRAHEDPRGLYWREDGHCRAGGYGVIAAEVHGLLGRRGGELGLR